MICAMKWASWFGRKYPISEHMEEAVDNIFTQMTELIVQNYNHPSIYCWGLSNEITVVGVRQRK